MTVPLAESSTARPSASVAPSLTVAVEPRGVGHLRGDGALPDQLVERELLAAQLPGHLRRRAEPVTGGADRLVRLLGVLDLLLVAARRVRHVLRAVQVAGLATGGGQRRLGQRRAVRTHVGDVAVLVQPLGDPHRVLAGQAQLAAGLLLQRRGGERRGRPTGVRLLGDVGHRDGGAPDALGDRGRGRLVEVGHAGRAQGAVVGEVAAGGDPLALDRAQPRGEGLRALGVLRREVALDVPVRRPAERHPQPLPLDHHARRHGLHPAGGQALADLAPQHRGDLVAVEPVEDAPGLLGVHEPGVELAGLVRRALDRLLGDLVEHHPADRHLGLEHLEQVPGDGLALAVLIGGQQELVGVLEQPLELGDLLALVGVDDVVRLEAVVDVDRELAVGTLLHVRRQLAGVRQVPDVPDRRLDVVVLAEVAGDRLGLGR